MAERNSDPRGARSTYADTAPVDDRDRALLEASGGRAEPDDREPSAMQDEIREKTATTRPVSDKTNVHLSGTGAVETDDGLDEEVEALRHAVEDVADQDVGNGDADDEERAATATDEEADPDAAGDRDEVPVFERGDRI